MPDDLVVAQLARIEHALRHQAAQLARIELAIAELAASVTVRGDQRNARRATLAAIHAAVGDTRLKARWVCEWAEDAPGLRAALLDATGHPPESAAPELGKLLAAWVGGGDGLALIALRKTSEGRLYELRMTGASSASPEPDGVAR